MGNTLNQQPDERKIECDKIVPAVIAAKGEIGSLHKTGRNNFHNYSYLTFDDLIGAVEPVLRQHGLVLSSSVIECDDLEPRQTGSGGKMFRSRVRMLTTLRHSSGQVIQGISVGEGEDTSDKAAYKAQTGARKYGVMGILNLSTSDDPEKEGAAGDAAARPAPARPQTQPPASRPAPSGGGPLPAQGARTFTVAEVIPEEGIAKASGKPYTRYVVVVAEHDNGEELRFKTMKKHLADMAASLIGKFATIQYQYQPQFKSYDLIDIQPSSIPQQDATAMATASAEHASEEAIDPAQLPF